MKKSFILIICFILFTSCTDNSTSVVTSDITSSEVNSQVTSEITSNVSSETAVSDMDNDILPWISEYLEPHIPTRDENYIDENYIKEIAFAITGDKSVPDMFILTNEKNNSASETMYAFRESDCNDIGVMWIAYPFHENTKEQITTPIMRDGNMGVKIERFKREDGIIVDPPRSKPLSEYAPKLVGTKICDSNVNSFCIYESTNIINFSESILEHYKTGGMRAIKTNSLLYLFGELVSNDTKVRELKENPDVLIDYIKANYYNSTTGLYEMYFGEEGIIDYLRYGKEYEYPGGENLRNIVVTKEEYEKLYAQLMGLFTETEFPWVYKSGILPDNYTKENLNQIAREASKSYLEYVASSNKE